MSRSVQRLHSWVVLVLFQGNANNFSRRDEVVASEWLVFHLPQRWTSLILAVYASLGLFHLSLMLAMETRL